MENIFIVEDDIIIAENLQNILETNNYNICGIASNYNDAIIEIMKEFPDILICDIYLEAEKTGIELAHDIQKIKHLPVVFITAFSGDGIIQQVVDISTVAYITKPYTNAQVIATIKMITAKNHKFNETNEITRREKEIVELLKIGLSSIDIATKLYISVGTVKTHRKHIFAKYKVNSIAQLINKLYEE